MLALLVAVLLSLSLLAAPASAGDSFNLGGVDEWRVYNSVMDAPYIYSGCQPVVGGGSLTLGAFACTAFVSGPTGAQEAIVQSSIAFTLPSSGDGEYWLLAYRDSSSTVSGWVRSATTTTKGSRYLAQKSATLPATPAGGIIFARVTVSGGLVGNIAYLGNRAAPSAVQTMASIVEYGGVGNGTADASGALQGAVDSGKCVYLPEGTWYVGRSVTKTSGSVCLQGAGMGRTVLKAFAGAIAGCSGDYSYNMLNLSGQSSVLLKDLTFDGNVTSVSGFCDTGSYLNQYALVEITSSDKVVLDRVEFTKFNGTVPQNSGGGTMNPAGFVYNQKQGPLWIADSTHILLQDNHLTSPSFVEGLTIVESGPGIVRGLISDAGRDSHATYGASSPLRILGITSAAQDWEVTGSLIKNPNGSWLGAYLDANLNVHHNTITCDSANLKLGFCGGFNATPDLLNTTGTPPEGVDPGDVPIFDQITYDSNTQSNANTYCVVWGRSAISPVVTKASNVKITNNTCRGAWVGIYGGATAGAHIAGNNLSEVIQYNATASYGSAIVMGQASSDVTIVNNRVDGTVSVSNGVGLCNVVSGCYTQWNIALSECERCKVSGNHLVGAATGNLQYSVGSADDGVYGNLQVTDNQIKNVVLAPASPILLGTDGTHRLDSLYIKGNVINGAPSNGGNTTLYVKTTLTDESQLVRATRTATQAIPNGFVLTTIIYNATVVNPTLEYDSSTGIFTARVRGAYTFGTNLVLGALETTKQMEAFLSVNGSAVGQICHVVNTTGGNDNVTCTGSSSTTLAVGDTAKIQVRHNGTAGTLDIAAGAQLTGYYIGRN